MKRLILVGLTICASVYADNSETSENRKYFEKRYLNENRVGVSEARTLEFNSMASHEVQTSDMNISQYIIDNNISDFGKKNKNEIATKAAEEMNLKVRTKSFQHEVAQNTEFLLNDKELDWNKYMGKHKYAANQVVKQMKETGSAYFSKNQWLDPKDRLIVVISSSMPDELIKKYFEQLENVNTDVSFVLRGMVGGVSKLMPTADFIDKLLVKDEKEPRESTQNRYSYDVAVNPKITQRYGIEKVPAVVFIKNYDPIAESYSGGIGKPHDDEDYWVMYGDMEVEYVLKEINKRAKREGLKHLIKAMKSNYFEG